MSQENNPVNSGSRKKSPELKLRLISVAVGLPLVAITLYFGFWTVSIVSIIVAVIAAWETRDLAYGPGGSYRSRIFMLLSGAVTAGAVVAAAAVEEMGNSYSLIDPTGVAVGFLFLLLIAEFAITARYREIVAVRRNIVLAYGAAVVLAVSVLPLIVLFETGRELLAYVLLVVFAADSGAFFVGKSLGRHRMAASISPGKTWEGFIGGVAAALLVSWLVSKLLSFDYSVVEILGMGLGIACLGVAGDLCESWIKRLSCVKDSGGIIPGHGGLLDRLDALAPNFMFIYFIERWFA